MYGFGGFGSVDGAVGVIEEVGKASSGASVFMIVGAEMEDIVKDR